MALLGIFLLASCSDILGPAGDPAVEFDEWIVFVSDRVTETGEEVLDIFRMNPDGSEVLNLTSHPSPFYTDLGLSPDHSTLLFRTIRSGCYEIWSIHMDSLEPLQLTGPGEACNTRPRWSPDGSMIGFTSSRDGPWEVYVMEADGSAPRNVSNGGGAALGYSNSMHRWSADGRMAFIHSVGSAGSNTLMVNPDGTGLQLLSEDHPEWNYPHWSPDGSRMTVLDDEGLKLVAGGGTDVISVSGDEGDLFAGSPLRPLDPWSPDGSRVVATGSRAIYVTNADGTGLATVVAPEGNNVFHGWSPDGTRIAFSSDRAGTWDIYVVNIDGTGLQRITDGSGNDRDAVWVPRR